MGRRRAHVASKIDRLQVLQWMMETVAAEGTAEKIAARAVSHLPF